MRLLVLICCCAVLGLAQVVPAGSHLVVALKSPLHTTSATAGSQVYAETVFPLVHDNQIVIPAHSQVLGVVEVEARPGRVKRRASFLFRFTQVILPDNRVLSINAGLQSLPGSAKLRSKGERGRIEPVDQIDKDVSTVVHSTAIGAMAGVFSHGLIGIRGGAAIGAGVGVARAMFTRGNEINLPSGTTLEIVFTRSALE